MAVTNTNAGFGFKPVRRLDGAAWSGNMTVRKIANADTNVLCKGDVAKTLNTGYITVGAAGLTDHSNIGVFYGCKYLSTTLGYTIWSNRWPGSGATGDIDAFIIDDPFVVYEVQASAAAIPFAAIGENADYVVATGNTSSGISAWTLNSTTASTTTFPWKVIGFPATNTVPGSDIASSFNLVEVSWNDNFLTQKASI